MGRVPEPRGGRGVRRCGSGHHRVGRGGIQRHTHAAHGAGAAEPGGPGAGGRRGDVGPRDVASAGDATARAHARGRLGRRGPPRAPAADRRLLRGPGLRRRRGVADQQLPRAGAQAGHRLPDRGGGHHGHGARRVQPAHRRDDLHGDVLREPGGEPGPRVRGPRRGPAVLAAVAGRPADGGLREPRGRQQRVLPRGQHAARDAPDAQQLRVEQSAGRTVRPAGPDRPGAGVLLGDPAARRRRAHAALPALQRQPHARGRGIRGRAGRGAQPADERDGAPELHAGHLGARGDATQGKGRRGHPRVPALGPLPGRGGGGRGGGGRGAGGAGAGSATRPCRSP